MLALAIDLGGTHATCAVLRDASIAARCTITPDARLGDTLPIFARTLRALATEARIALEECAGLALGFCGLVDADAGRVLSTNRKYDDAPQLDLAAWSAHEFGLPFRMENDARMALLGEHRAGAARGFNDAVMVTLGTGIGGAAMIGGALLRGRHYQAGCLGGHLPVNPRGRRCTCGSIGCAESEASTWALPAVCESWPGFAESTLATCHPLDFAALFRTAATGDAVARGVLDHCLDVWACLTVGLIHAYDPEVVVFGGGVMRSADRILPAIRQRVEESAWTPWGKVEVRTAQCGEDATLLGAPALLEEKRP